MIHAAPCGNRHVGISVHDSDRLVVDGVGDVCCSRSLDWTCVSVVPRQNFAISVQACFEIGSDRWAIIVLLHVVFTAEHGLHRNVEPHCNLCGVINDIPVEGQAATESASQVARMVCHCALIQPGN